MSQKLYRGIDGVEALKKRFTKQHKIRYVFGWLDDQPFEGSADVGEYSNSHCWRSSSDIGRER